MLYSEFVQGTGCRETDHNYKVYKDLEIMYMNSDMSKEQIYEYGKKLVDNSKTEAELKIEAEAKAEIETLKSEIEGGKRDIERYEAYIEIETDKDSLRMWKDSIRYLKQEIIRRRNRIKMLREMFLAA